MTTETSELLLPGYRIEPVTGAWCSLPWPDDPDERAKLARSSLGPAIIDWSEGRTEEPGLQHYVTGKPWRWTRGQKRFLVLWYHVDRDGRFTYRSGVKRGAKGPIAHDTPVMTPTGWVKHGDLVPGDTVYALDGSPTRVLEVHPEVLDDCYRVTFRDGESVVCTGDHRWVMDRMGTGATRLAQTVTVEQMLTEGVRYERPLTAGKTKATRAGGAQWRTQRSPVVKGRKTQFPFDPYAFGYWLGDGDSSGSRITVHRDDLPSLMAELTAVGLDPSEPKHTHGETYRVSFGRGHARAALRAFGVLDAKHIPQRLLRGSVEQRWALLQGLVDSDGTVSKGHGTVSIGLSAPGNAHRLGPDVFELAVSLGLQPMMSYNERTNVYLIHFTPQRGEVVSRLPRKLARTQPPKIHSYPFSRSRSVVSIEPTLTVPARCITVEHPSHQYLVGYQNVPTCNTGKDPIAAAMCNGELCGPVEMHDWDDASGRPIGLRRGFPLVQVMSNSLEQSRDVLRVANAMWSREAREFYSLDCGETRTIQKVNGGRFEIPPSSEASGEGDPATFVALNESHHMTVTSGGSRVAAMGRRNVAKSPGSIQARLCEFTNAHRSGEGSVAEASFGAWQTQLSPKHPGKRDILYDSIEAPPTTDIMTEEGRMAGLAASYSDSPWSDLPRLSAEMMDSRTSVADTIRYYLNGLAAEEDAWVDPGNFDALAAPDTVVADGDQIVLFLDCSKSEDATGLVACRLSDMFVWPLGVWQRPRGWNDSQRGRWLVPREVVDAEVRAAFARYRVAWFGVDPSPARDDADETLYWMSQIDAWHRDYAKRLPVWATPGSSVHGHSVLFDMRISQTGGTLRNAKFTATAEMVAGMIDEEGSLRHNGDSILRLHVHNAKRRPNQWGISLGKVTRDSSKHVDLAVCMVGAVMGAREVMNSGKVRLTARRSRVIALD